MNQALKNSLVTVLFAAVAATASRLGVSYFVLRSRVPGVPDPTFLTARAKDLLPPDRAYRGDAGSPYTLVEFMDYQCPPCKRTQPAVDALVLKNKGKLRYTIRNLPLAMHPNALPAAIAAEAAGEQNDFWRAHDALIQSAEIAPARIAAIVAQQHLDAAHYAQATAGTAKRRVASDTAQAKTLGLHGTPSFLLCCPDGKVMELHSLDQINRYLK